MANVKIQSIGGIPQSKTSKESVIGVLSDYGNLNGTLIPLKFQHNRNIDTAWIKGRRCLMVQRDEVTDICYLDENNSALFPDGTSADFYENDFDMMGINYMTELPEYWFKVEGQKISLIPNETSGFKRSPKVYVGTFKGSIWQLTEPENNQSPAEHDGNYVNVPLMSIPDKYPLGSLYIDRLGIMARSNGDGFSLINYNTHCKIAHMYYAKYGDTDIQSNPLFGYGSYSYRRAGSTMSLGNNDGHTGPLTTLVDVEEAYFRELYGVDPLDTLPEVSVEEGQINLFGIEDAYGNIAEYLEGLFGLDGDYYTTDNPNVTMETLMDGTQNMEELLSNLRLVAGGGYWAGASDISKRGWVSKFLMGPDADLIPVGYEAFYNSGFSCFGRFDTDGNNIIPVRACYKANPYDGVGFITCEMPYNPEFLGMFPFVGGRIQYSGEVNVLTPDEFKEKYHFDGPQ